MTGQDVDDDIRRMHAVAERLGTSRLHGRETVGQYRAEDIDHLSIAIV